MSVEHLLENFVGIAIYDVTIRPLGGRELKLLLLPAFYEIVKPHQLYIKHAAQKLQRQVL